MPLQIILVHILTKFQCFIICCCIEIQGDAKLHHPRDGMFKDPRRGVEGGSQGYSKSRFHAGFLHKSRPEMTKIHVHAKGLFKNT